MNYGILFIVTLSSFLMLCFAQYLLGSSLQKLFIFGGVFGIYFYCGIGAAYPGVEPSYTLFYIIFQFVLVSSFIITSKLTVNLSRKMGERLLPVMLSIEKKRAFLTFIVIVYFFSLIFPLIYPKLCLDILFNPPQVQSASKFTVEGLRFVREVNDTPIRLVGYVEMLVFPFYLIILYQFRRNFIKMVFLWFAPLYIQYCVGTYVSRGMILIYLSVLFLIIWLERPRWRSLIIVSLVIIIPAIIYFFHWYAIIRIGGEPGNLSLLESARKLLINETSFPIVGTKILKGDYHVNFRDYLVWICTLPIPKLLTGGIQGARINYEIAEIVLGIPITSRNFYVVLSGVVNESIYIYGKYFFWLHALFIGLIFAFISRLIERVPHFIFVEMYIFLMFAYIMNRGGVASFLYRLTNHFLSFYIFIFISYFQQHGSLVKRTGLALLKL